MQLLSGLPRDNNTVIFFKKQDFLLSNVKPFAHLKVKRRGRRSARSKRLKSLPTSHSSIACCTELSFCGFPSFHKDERLNGAPDGRRRSPPIYMNCT
jgi:hypothetical protein